MPVFHKNFLKKVSISGNTFPYVYNIIQDTEYAFFYAALNLPFIARSSMVGEFLAWPSIQAVVINSREETSRELSWKEAGPEADDLFVEPPLHRDQELLLRKSEERTSMPDRSAFLRTISLAIPL